MTGELDLVPPKAVADAAAKGLKLRAEHKRGGTQVGVKRARQLSARERLSPADVKKMHAYFARHEVDRSAPKFDDADEPSAGKIAWLLWGGDPGRTWADRMAKKLDAGD